MGTTSIPLFIPPTPAPTKAATTPRVPTFKYPVPSHSLDEWKAKVAVDSHSPIHLTIATAHAILSSLADGVPTVTHATTSQQLGGRESILSLASYLHQILDDAMSLATTLFPLKANTPRKGKVLPHHPWSKSVLHDIHNICHRTKTLCRLAKLLAMSPAPEEEPPSDAASPHHTL